MTNYGHFGLPSIRLAIGSGIAFLIHLILPYGVVQYRGPAAPDSNWLSRGEWMDLRRLAPSEMLANNASPDVALAGLVIATVAAGLLVFLGFQPLQVAAARWIAAGLSTLAALGLAMAWMQSMYAVGTGFATFLHVLFGSEFRTGFWAFSPVLVAAATGYLTWQASKVALKVVATRDGLRDQATHGIKQGTLGMVFIGMVLLVPWSIGLFPEGVSDSLGTQLPEDDKAPFWFSAEDVQSVTPSEAAGRIRNTDAFDVLSASIHVFLALGWTLHVHGALQVLATTAASANDADNLAAGSRFTIYAPALLLFAALIMYVLAWIFVKPDPDVTETYLPGFFPILVLAPLLWMAKDILPGLVGLMQPANLVSSQEA